MKTTNDFTPESVFAPRFIIKTVTAVGDIVNLIEDFGENNVYYVKIGKDEVAPVTRLTYVGLTELVKRAGRGTAFIFVRCEDGTNREQKD